MRLKILIGFLAWMLAGQMNAALAQQELSDEELEAVSAGAAEIVGLDGVLRYDLNDGIEFHKNPRLNVSVEGKAAVELSAGLVPDTISILGLRDAAQPGRQAVLDLNAVNHVFPFLPGVDGDSSVGQGASPMLNLFGAF